MLKLRNYRSRAKGLADLLPYAGLVGNGIIVNKDSSMMGAWVCKGSDTTSSTASELGFQTYQFNQAAKLLGSGWMLNMDAFRTTHRAYSPPEASHFTNDICRMIDEERRQRFDDHCFTTTTVLTATYMPDFRIAALADKTRENSHYDYSQAFEREIERFQATLRELQELLTPILRMERLFEYSTEDTHANAFIQSDILSHLQQCITGTLQPMRVPPVPMYLDAIVGGKELFGGTQPKLDDKYISVISIDGMPSASQASMLHTLDSLPINFRWSTRAILMDKYTAEQEIKTYWKTWNQQVFRFLDSFFSNPNAKPNHDALLMRDDAEGAKVEVQNGTVGACYVTSSVVLMDKSLEALKENSFELRRNIRNLGFGCRIETINALEAWLGTLPGNSYPNVRRPMVHTVNLAHMLPLSTMWTGQDHNPCPFYPPNSPPLAVELTDGQTPFWLNVHVRDIAHALIVGMIGGGKSTLLCHLADQAQRYKNSQIFSFDKGLSMYALTLGVKGKHYDIGTDRSLAFAPLQDLDSEEDLLWCAEWIANLMVLQGMAVLPGHTNAIRDGLTRLAGNPREMRGLSEFWNVVPDADVKGAVLHYTVKGSMGHLLDAREDTLGFSDFTTFEIETLMNMGEKNLLPVLLYIFRRIEKSLTGRPSFILIDEAWIVLGHKIFRDKIREWLKVFRKKNCGVIMATQSLSDLKNSGIMDVLIDSCPTRFLLPDESARQEDHAAIYKELGCNDAMIDQLATAVPKRDYMVIQPDGKRIIQLALGPKELAFVGVSDPERIAKIKKLHRTHGPDLWQHEWLKICNAI